MRPIFLESDCASYHIGLFLESLTLCSESKISWIFVFLEYAKLAYHCIDRRSENDYMRWYNTWHGRKGREHGARNGEMKDARPKQRRTRLNSPTREANQSTTRRPKLRSPHRGRREQPIRKAATKIPWIWCTTSFFYPNKRYCREVNACSGLVLFLYKLLLSWMYKLVKWSSGSQNSAQSVASLHCPMVYQRTSWLFLLMEWLKQGRVPYLEVHVDLSTFWSTSGYLGSTCPSDWVGDSFLLPPESLYSAEPPRYPTTTAHEESGPATTASDGPQHQLMDLAAQHPQSPVNWIQ